MLGHCTLSRLLFWVLHSWLLGSACRPWYDNQLCHGWVCFCYGSGACTRHDDVSKGLVPLAHALHTAELFALACSWNCAVRLACMAPVLRLYRRQYDPDAYEALRDAPLVDVASGWAALASHLYVAHRI